MVYITRKEHFNAAHKLWRPEWSDEKNHTVFGKCANPNWHGHNYTLLVTVKGVVNPETGYLVDLKDLSRIIKEEILDALDHKNLNLDVPFMSGKMASTEVLAVEIWNRLLGPLQHLPCTMHSIQLFETENNSVTYYGE
jgi:6-pyruvoyltetrahydropterin/6-carboxytetrahydropterin synthase